MKALLSLMKRKAIWTLVLVPLFLSAGDANNPCVKGSTFHIVILGSSTAAGSGPTHPDSAWVNRYRGFLQSINPQNQVTNLAQGGTTTYHIMPDWYAAPTGRPTRNTAKNVSEAIRLQADAIIVNMPSNDAANGFSVSEQMNNFHTIVNSADSAGIPVWVCTTQPRNFSTTQKQLQMAVRDSILSQFGMKALDFWSGFADSTGGLDTNYDSGDGVHMNNRAHRILDQRARSLNILSQLTDTLSKQDHFISSIRALVSICGMANDSVWISLSNRGVSSTTDLPVRWRIEDMLTGAVSNSYDTIKGGVATCDHLSQVNLISTSLGGKWRVSAHLETLGDSISDNDHSDTIYVSRRKHPVALGQDQMVCNGDPAWLYASGGDSTLWLDSTGVIVGYGDSLQLGILRNPQNLTARLVTGDLHYNEKLFTHDNSNIDFNGVMFDLVATTDTLVIDSLSVRPSQTTLSELTARYHLGSYKGFESDASAWLIWGKDSVQPLASGDLAMAQFGPMMIPPGDTLGVYLSMQNGSSLKYQSLSSEALYASGPLNLISGSGIGQGFSSTYYPRAWSGMVYFHYGFNPFGDCSNDTVLVADVFPNYLNLGSDTSLAFNEQLALSLPSGLFDPIWSTGDTLSLVYIDSSMADSNYQVQVWVKCTDIFGCSLTDTILVSFASGLALDIPESYPNLSIYPNPTREKVSLVNPGMETLRLKVFNLAGQKLEEFSVYPGTTEFHFQYVKGIYLIYCDDYPHSSTLLKIMD